MGLRLFKKESEVLIMTNQSKIIGKIEISTDQSLSQEILSKIQETISYLHKENVDVVFFQESNLKDGFKVIIKILEIGDISDKQMREAFKTMFFGIKDGGNFSKLIDKDKEFRLPDDIEECLDWFIIEK